MFNLSFLEEESNVRLPESDEMLLFLDFDGVVHPVGEIHFASKWTEMKPLLGSQIFLQEKVELVTEVCVQTNSKIVVSSSWKDMEYGLPVYNEIFDGHVIARTPFVNSHFGETGQREIEIITYIENNDLKNHYAIIDDQEDNFFMGNQHLFVTESSVGLTRDIAEKVIRYLQK